MARTGFAHLPLHGGRAPSWLFQRMVPLSREIVMFIATEFGREEVLRGTEDELGIYVASGKGATSRKTPGEITIACEHLETLLSIEGVGAKTLRAWALTSELIYGKQASHKDPARYSFAHGGKDGTPFPVDRKTYDKTIEVMRTALNAAKIDRTEKVRAFKRLADFAQPVRAERGVEARTA